MPKRVPVEAKRVPLNCLVLPETLAWLKAQGVSQGVAIDRLVARVEIQLQQAALQRQQYEFRTPAPTQTILDDTEVIRAVVDAEIKRHNQRTFKPPLLKPKDQRSE